MKYIVLDNFEYPTDKPTYLTIGKIYKGINIDGSDQTVLITDDSDVESIYHIGYFKRLDEIQLKCIKSFTYGKAQFISGKIYSTEITQVTYGKDYYTIIIEDQNSTHFTFDFNHKKEYFIDISEIREEKLNQILDVL
jgi:hypothetical protein